MVKQLLDEVPKAPLDEAGRVRLRESTSIAARPLSSASPPTSAAELDRMAIPRRGHAERGELRIAQAHSWAGSRACPRDPAASWPADGGARQLDEIAPAGLPQGAQQAPSRPGTYL